MLDSGLVYIPLTSDGYLSNISSKDFLEETDRLILEDIVSRITQILPNKAGQIYLRGSLAYGRFMKAISDMDIVVLTSEDLPLLSTTQMEMLIDNVNKEYASRYNLVDISYYNKGILSDPKNNRLLMNLALTGILFYQYDCDYCLPRLQFDFKLQTKIINQTLSDCEKTIELIRNRQEIDYMGRLRQADFLCVWFMRDFCRGLIALVMNKKRVFSLNVSTCCYEFAHAYPQYCEFAEQIWRLERMPTSDWSELETIALNAINIYREIVNIEGYLT